MANVNYDTLTIEVNVDSKQANRSINTLSKNLLALEKVAKDLDIKAIKNAQKCLQDIAKIDFSNVSQGLKDVVSAFKAMQSKISSKSLAGSLKETLGGGLNGSANQGEQALANANVEETVEAITTLYDRLSDIVSPELATKLSTMFDDFKNGVRTSVDDVARVKNEISSLIATEKIDNGSTDNPRLQNLKAISSILTQIQAQAQPVKQSLNDIQKSSAGEGDSGGDKDGKKGLNGLQKLFSAFKRVLFYRIVRRLIQLVAQAIKQGIQNLAKFSSEFNETMSNLKSSLVYIKNALGTMIAPIIQLLEPVLVMLMDMFANLANKIGELFSALNGKDTFAKATKSAEDYAKSLNKATLGIDELNVIQQDGGNYEWTPVSDEAKEQAETLRGIIEEVKGIIQDIKPLVMEIIKAGIDFVKRVLPLIKPLLHAIRELLTPIVSLITLLIEDTYELVNDSLASVVELVSKIISMVGRIISSLLPVLVPIIRVIAEIINFINTLIKNIADFFSNLLGDTTFLEGLLTTIAIVLGVIVNAIASLMGVINAVLTVIGDIVNGNWDMIGTHWEEAMSKISDSWSQDFTASVASTPTAQGYNTEQDIGGRMYPQDSSQQINVYIDGDEVAKRVNKINSNRGVGTLKGGTLSYGK